MENWKEDLQEVSIELANTYTDTSKELKPQRYQICKSCDRFNNMLKLCGECGCFMPMKTLMKNESCPLNKW